MKVRDYRGYKKAVKRAGAKEIATPQQYKRIKQRLRKRYGKTLATDEVTRLLKQAGIGSATVSKLRGLK